MNEDEKDDEITETDKGMDMLQAQLLTNGFATNSDEITETDKEKIKDAIDTEDLGAKADYEYAKEKDESVMSK